MANGSLVSLGIYVEGDERVKLPLSQAIAHAVAANRSGWLPALSYRPPQGSHRSDRAALDAMDRVDRVRLR